MKTNWKNLILVFVLGLLVNAVWEISHSFLYSCAPNLKEHMPMIIRATFWDAGYITLLFIFIGFFKDNFNWFRKVEKRDIVFILFIGFLTATTVELHALYLDKWSYKEVMPLVPYLKIGLTPFLQLAFTSLFVFFWLNLLTKGSK